MEILSDRYFFMKEESIWNGYHFYADKPYLAKTRIEDGEKVVSFMAENGCMKLKEKAFKKMIDSWMLIDAYKCPCCSGYSSDYINNTTDKHEPSYYIKDGTIHITDHFLGTFCEFKVNNCPICGGKV